MGTRKEYWAKFADYTARSLLPTSPLVRERSGVQSSVAAPPSPSRKDEYLRWFDADYSVTERRLFSAYGGQRSAPNRIPIGDRLGTVTGRVSGRRADMLILDDLYAPSSLDITKAMQDAARRLSENFYQQFMELVKGPTPTPYMDWRKAPPAPAPRDWYAGRPPEQYENSHHTIIYRVEDEDGRGMYQRGLVFEGGGPASERHPMPYDDLLLMANGWNKFRDKHLGNYRFGFGSLEQLRSWVYSEYQRDAIKRHNYSINIYVAEVAIVGDTQAVFVINSAHRIGEVDITTMQERYNVWR